MYTGEWRNDLRHGQGEETFAQDQSHFVGNYFDGKMHGKGLYTWKDGSSFKGNWVGNKITGTVAIACPPI